MQNAIHLHHNFVKLRDISILNEMPKEVGLLNETRERVPVHSRKTISIYFTQWNRVFIDHSRHIRILIYNFALQRFKVLKRLTKPIMYSITHKQQRRQIKYCMIVNTTKHGHISSKGSYNIQLLAPPHNS